MLKQLQAGVDDRPCHAEGKKSVFLLSKSNYVQNSPLENVSLEKRSSDLRNGCFDNSLAKRVECPLTHAIIHRFIYLYHLDYQTFSGKSFIKSFHPKIERKKSKKKKRR